MVALLLIWLMLAPVSIGLTCALAGLPVGVATLTAIAFAAVVAWLGLRILERT